MSSQLFGSGEKPFLMTESGRETLPDVQEWSGGLPGCPGGTPSCPGVVGVRSVCLEVIGMPSRKSGSCRETLPDVREWWEALQDVRK